MKSDWIDAHCHLSDSRFGQNLEDVLERSRSVGVSRWVLAGYSPEDWERQQQLKAELGKSLYLSFGLHPWWVDQQPMDQIVRGLEDLGKLLPKANMVGELGLDSYGKRNNKESLEKQWLAFEKQLTLAKDGSRPVCLHVVRAHEPLLKHLEKNAPLQGWVHSFSGSAEQAARYVSLGLCVSLSGSAVRVPEKRLAKIMEAIPEDRLLIETDSPDQAPALPGISLPNEPANLVQIADYLSRFCGKSSKDLLDQSRDTIERVLGGP